MERWIDAIKRCYGIDEPLVGVSHVDIDFEIFDGADQSEVIRVLGGKCAAAYSWQNNGTDYLFAIGRVTVADPYDQNAAIDELFGRLYGKECEADIFSMREVIIDDMQGVEICGIADGHDDTVFYALYLADRDDVYFAAAFSDAEPELVFDELSGVSRTFYRQPTPAVVRRGKNSSPVFTALRMLANKALPDESSAHLIRNTTFDVESGVVSEEFAVVGVTDDNIEHLSGKDFYEGTDILKDADAFLAIVANKYDIAGFSVTCFKDGRYSVTFYPLADEENDEEHHHGKQGAENDEGAVEREEILEERIFAFASKLAGMYPNTWQRSLNLAVTCGEEAEELAFDTLVSENGAYNILELPDSFDSVLENELPELSELLEEHYGEISLFLFSFEKDAETGAVDRSSISFSKFLFDEYFDGCGLVDADDDELLSSFTHIFFDKLNGSEAIISASFKIAQDSDGVFFVDTPYITTLDGVKSLECSNELLDAILKETSFVLSICEYGDSIQFTIFPDAKLGIAGEETDEDMRLDDDSFSELIDECELGEYKKEIKKLLRNEIAIDSYSASQQDMIKIGASKAGGSPDLAQGEKWPSDSNGLPMAFVAQINLAESAPFDVDAELPKNGRLAFFFSEAACECKVLYTDSKELSRVTFVDALGRGDIIPSGAEDALREFQPALFRFGSSLSVPVMMDGMLRPPFLDEEKEDVYQDIAWLNDRVKMFGYPFLESDETDSSRDKGNKLLFQLPSLSECGMSWGDGGTVYFWIKAADLKKLCFDKCICEVQSYGMDGDELNFKE